MVYPIFPMDSIAVFGKVGLVISRLRPVTCFAKYLLFWIPRSIIRSVLRLRTLLLSLSMLIPDENVLRALSYSL